MCLLQKDTIVHILTYEAAKTRRQRVFISLLQLLGSLRKHEGNKTWHRKTMARQL